MNSLVPYAFIVFILIWVIFIITDHKNSSIIEERTKVEDKINSIKLKIEQIERKIDYVENTHGYTSVTTLLRYEIEQLEKKLADQKTILMSLK